MTIAPQTCQSCPVQPELAEPLGVGSVERCPHQVVPEVSESLVQVLRKVLVEHEAPAPGDDQLGASACTRATSGSCAAAAAAAAESPSGERRTTSEERGPELGRPASGDHPVAHLHGVEGRVTFDS